MGQMSGNLQRCLNPPELISEALPIGRQYDSRHGKVDCPLAQSYSSNSPDFNHSSLRKDVLSGLAVHWDVKQSKQGKRHCQEVEFDYFALVWLKEIDTEWVTHSDCGAERAFYRGVD